MHIIRLGILLLGLVLVYGSIIVLGGGKGGPSGMMGEGGQPSGVVFGHMSQQRIDNTNAQWSPWATREQVHAVAQRSQFGTSLPGAVGMGQGGQGKVVVVTNSRAM